LIILIVYDQIVDEKRNSFLALCWISNIIHPLKFIYLFCFQCYRECEGDGHGCMKNNTEFDYWGIGTEIKNFEDGFKQLNKNAFVVLLGGGWFVLITFWILGDWLHLIHKHNAAVYILFNFELSLIFALLSVRLVIFFVRFISFMVKSNNIDISEKVFKCIVSCILPGVSIIPFFYESDKFFCIFIMYLLQFFNTIIMAVMRGEQGNYYLLS